MMTAACNWTTPMATLTIRKLDADLKERLRVRAAQHGHSMEAEARDILKENLKEPERPPERNLYERIRARFAPLGGADDLELPCRESRSPIRRALIDVYPRHECSLECHGVRSGAGGRRVDRRADARIVVHHFDLSGRNPLRHLPFCRRAAGARVWKRRRMPCSAKILPVACCRSTAKRQLLTRTSFQRAAAPGGQRRRLI